jgi:hypothetical protein
MTFLKDYVSLCIEMQSVVDLPYFFKNEISTDESGAVIQISTPLLVLLLRCSAKVMAKLLVGVINFFKEPASSSSTLSSSNTSVASSLLPRVVVNDWDGHTRVIHPVQTHSNATRNTASIENEQRPPRRYHHLELPSFSQVETKNRKSSSLRSLNSKSSMERLSKATRATVFGLFDELNFDQRQVQGKEVDRSVSFREFCMREGDDIPESILRFEYDALHSASKL